MFRPACLAFLAAAVPISLYAQLTPARSPNPAADNISTANAADDASSAAGAATNSTDTPAEAAAQRAKSPTQQPAKPSKPSADLPPIEGSMVGYIDNAVVGSQIRVRFDDAFGNNAPDRAEFFYAQCGCDGPGAHGPGPGLATNLNFQQLYLRGEYAPLKRLSFIVDVPIRWLQPQSFDLNTVPAGQQPFGNQSGISDVQAGFKFALVGTQRRYLTFQFMASFPSGDSTRGLGTGHYSVAPSLLYFQRVTDRFSFEGEVGDTHPTSSSGAANFAGDVFMYGIGPSYELYHGENLRFAPVVELVGWHVLGGMENNDAALIASGYTNPFLNPDGINIVNLKAGFRTSIGHHQSFYAGFGQALTHDLWYKHIVRLEYRYTF
ncbi:MAG: hypothetical protein ABSG69_11645 [Candidatus Acidiferrum sp.]